MGCNSILISCLDHRLGLAVEMQKPLASLARKMQANSAFPPGLALAMHDAEVAMQPTKQFHLRARLEINR